MRCVILLSVLFGASIAKGQNSLPGSFIDYAYRGNALSAIRTSDTTHSNKWFLNKYSGVSTSFSFFRGGNATVVSVPVRLQLNRKITNNLFAFAGVSVAPAYVNFNSAFLSADFNKQNSRFNSSSLGLYSRAELGLMYVNDERTFSISGSIGIERSGYSMPAYSNRTNSIVSPANK